MTRYLVVGSGGREHAIAWKLSTETDAVVFVAPGSAGIAATEGVRCVDLAATHHQALADFAVRERIDLTVVGPEVPLVAGIADHFRARDLCILGPGAAAAQLEGSKAFAKDVMRAAGIPTAAYQAFEDLEPALDYVAHAAHPLVIKADGLAGGKGVVISDDLATSASTLRDFMGQRRFGEASERVVIEECLTGPELSFIVVTDGNGIVTLSTSRDHKRLRDGDRGPNTGGMGAITPSPDATPALDRQLVDTIVRPTLDELRARGLDYRGFLYVGLMLTPTGPQVLEFNVRLGDPETQALLVAMETDLGPTLVDAATGTLQSGTLATTRSACCVVLAADGYPEAPRRGELISPIPHSDVAHVFHAGTSAEADGFATAGGRVLAVVARGDDGAEARRNAYRLAAEITWDGRQMRTDIGL